MRFLRRSSTRSLTRSSLELASSQRHRRVLLLLVSFAAAAGLLAAGLHYFETHFSPARRVISLEEENTALKQVIDQGRVTLEMEKATRIELEKQLGDVNDELKRLQAELVFYKSQGRARP